MKGPGVPGEPAKEEPDSGSERKNGGPGEAVDPFIGRSIGSFHLEEKVGEGDTGTVYRAVFRSDGTVSSGTGAVYLSGGESFGSVTLYGAGGVDTHRWNGAEWEVDF